MAAPDDESIFNSACALFCESLLFQNSITPDSSFFGKVDNDDFELYGASLSEQGSSRKKRKIVETPVEREQPVPPIQRVYNDPDFKSHFRISKSTVEILLKMIPPPETFGHTKPGTPMIDSILLSLWLLGNREPFREVSIRFDIVPSIAHRVFHKFCDTVTTNLNKFIKWPQDLEAVARSFSSERICFPGVIGCLDSTHIVFCRRKFDDKRNVNKITLQAVCDSNLAFTDIYLCWPEMTRIGTVFDSSPLRERIEQENLIPPEYHILADYSYPLTQNILTPYIDYGILTEREKFYNDIVNTARSVTAQAFGQLFGRFRKLHYLYVLRRHLIPKIISTVCALHNLCIQHKDECPDVETNITLVSNMSGHVQGRVDEYGEFKRMNIDLSCAL